jgi:hypothetical protein
MVMIVEADCFICETHTKAEERCFTIEQSVLHDLCVDGEETVQHPACNKTQQKLMATVQQIKSTLPFLEW